MAKDSDRTCWPKYQFCAISVIDLGNLFSSFVRIVHWSRDETQQIRTGYLDRRIIAHLRTDGRASLTKLSDALGVARGTVQNRLDRLIETGTLIGFTVRVREDYDVNTIRAVMMVEVVGKSTTQVVRKLRGLTEFQRCTRQTAIGTLIADIRASSLADFDRLLREVRMIDGVAEQRDESFTEHGLSGAAEYPGSPHRRRGSDAPNKPANLNPQTPPYITTHHHRRSTRLVKSHRNGDHIAPSSRQNLIAVHQAGSYVRCVNVEARVFDPLARQCS